jgi:hypothetical protein
LSEEKENIEGGEGDYFFSTQKLILPVTRWLSLAGDGYKNGVWIMRLGRVIAGNGLR